MPKKATKKQMPRKPLCNCSLRHWDCIHCNEKGQCELLIDMEVVNKQKHCGFFKKRTDIL